MSQNQEKTSIKRHSDEIIHANRKLDHSLINPEIQRMKYVCIAPVGLFVIYLYVGFGAWGTKQYKSLILDERIYIDHHIAYRLNYLRCRFY